MAEKKVMDELGKLQQFRAERTENNVLHLVFDMPGRPMNVFSNAAIAELALFSRWLRDSDVKGVVIRSGKPSAFCAGADLGELGSAYDMIMAAPAERRDRVAFEHFFRLSQALRGIETAGKPVAAAIAGLALGGGGELALATHHRVMVDDPKVAFGLPESLVGLLPGGGGTQRLPRLTGIEKALPILLEGARLSGQAAIAAGVVDQLVAAGEEVAAAERWVLSHPSASQPWDRMSMMRLQSLRGNAKAFWPKPSDTIRLHSPFSIASARDCCSHSMRRSAPRCRYSQSSSSDASRAT
jgi:3-hydroxyacyl-CoA dehydrogenase/enoyl-CoA hydratase/3-hydroxybutyryl-CoA epimerase